MCEVKNRWVDHQKQWVRQSKPPLEQGVWVTASFLVGTFVSELPSSVKSMTLRLPFCAIVKFVKESFSQSSKPNPPPRTKKRNMVGRLSGEYTSNAMVTKDKIH